MYLTEDIIQRYFAMGINTPVFNNLFSIIFRLYATSYVMTQAREPLAIMDGNPPNCDFSTKTKRGLYLSRGLSFVILVIFILALVATSFIVYNFAACPRTDQLANVTKYEFHANHCGDNSKLLVIPLTTESSNHIVPSTTSPKQQTHLSITSENTPNEEETYTYMVTDVRLPTTIKPEKYFLKLTPYIYSGNFTFDGEVSIVFLVKNETDRVIFHAVDLYFHRVNLYQKSNGKSIGITRRTEDLVRQFRILMLSEKLKQGEKYILNITYTGILNDNLHGFYRSSYEEHNVTR